MYALSTLPLGYILPPNGVRYPPPGPMPNRFDGTGLCIVYSHFSAVSPTIMTPAWRLGATGGRVHAVLGRVSLVLLI